MSAFVVGNAHLNYLLSAGLRLGGPGNRFSWLVPAAKNPNAYQRGAAWGPAALEEAERRRRTLTAETADGVGSMLRAENLRSVNHRYDDSIEEEVGIFAFTECEQALEPVQVLKALDCYEYQTGEHPEWEGSEAHAFCNVLRQLAIGELPGYEEAHWDIPEKEYSK